MRRVNYIIALLALAWLMHDVWAEYKWLVDTHYPAFKYVIEDVTRNMAYSLAIFAKCLTLCIPRCMRQYVIDTVTVTH